MATNGFDAANQHGVARVSRVTAPEESRVDGGSFYRVTGWRSGSVCLEELRLVRRVFGIETSSEVRVANQSFLSRGAGPGRGGGEWVSFIITFLISTDSLTWSVQESFHPG